MANASLEEIVRAIVREEIEKALAARESGQPVASPPAPKRRGRPTPEQRHAVLSEVAGRAGRVRPEVWREIGRKHGYDPRGLGGFFTGPKAPMERVQDGKYVGITREGLKEWEQWFYRHPVVKGKGVPWPDIPLFKVSGKPLSETLLEMREEEYREGA